VNLIDCISSDELSWASSALAKAQTIFPRITPHGLDWADWGTPERWDSNDLAMVALARRYLTQCTLTKSTQKQNHALTHQIEEHFKIHGLPTHLCDGAPIVASIGLKIKVRPSPSSRLDALIGISLRSVRRLAKFTEELAPS
jgi:hypothetical protein